MTFIFDSYTKISFDLVHFLCNFLKIYNFCRTIAADQECEDVHSALWTFRWYRQSSNLGAGYA